MPHLDVPGASLHYESDGHAQAPALLLIHAGVANLRMWDPQLADLARDHLVVRYDTRGHGATEIVDAGRPFREIDDALAILDHLGVARATVVGASRGGGIGIDLALEHPDRVAGVVTIASAPSGFPVVDLTEEEDAAFDRLDTLFAAENWHELARVEAALWAYGPSRTEADVTPEFAATAAALNRVNARHAAVELNPVPVERPAYDRIVDLEQPALITVGALDLSSELAAYEFLAESLTDADGHVFETAAHLPSVERPEEFGPLLRRWLEQRGL